MKVRITHLKAPWPVGAAVGDVLDLAAVPVWAVGKCEVLDASAPVFVTQVTEEVSLKDQAKAIGIKVDGRWSDERIAEEIAKASK